MLVKEAKVQQLLAIENCDRQSHQRIHLDRIDQFNDWASMLEGTVHLPLPSSCSLKRVTLSSRIKPASYSMTLKQLKQRTDWCHR